MTINVGITGEGKANRGLRLTMNEADFAQAEQRWGESPRLSYAAAWSPTDGRWHLIFAPSPDGRAPHVQRPPAGGVYYSWIWGAKSPDALAGMPGIRAKAHTGELLRWNDDGTLEIVLRGKPAQPSTRTRSAPPAPVAVQPTRAVRQETTGTRVSRLAALRHTVNHAIRDLRAHGMLLRVDQSSPGEEVTMSIDI